MSYVVELTEDPDTGDLVMEFPPEIVKLLELEVGDELELTDNGDGSITIQKQ